MNCAMVLMTVKIEIVQSVVTPVKIFVMQFWFVQCPTDHTLFPAPESCSCFNQRLRVPSLAFRIPRLILDFLMVSSEDRQIRFPSINGEHDSRTA